MVDNYEFDFLESFRYLCSVWISRKPPGYAFIDFYNSGNAEDAIRELDGICRSIFYFYYNDIAMTPLACSFFTDIKEQANIQ